MVYNYLITQQKHYNNCVYELNDFVNSLVKLNSPFCFIIHDKETDIHYHSLVLGCALKKVEILDFLNSADITIVDNVIGSFEYLIHKNDSNKIQYDPNYIVYSSCSKDFILDYALERRNRKKSKEHILEELIDKIISHEFTSLTECFDFDKTLTFKNYFIIRELLERYNFIDLEEVL